MEIWIEKYRPSTFAEIRGQKNIVERIEAMTTQKSMPHLMFAGPSGVGKSTIALVIARTLFGEKWRENFLELNASDDRGIDIVRNTIKNFARLKSISNVPFKIIFLDECDSLTKDAQQALRRTMENFTKSTRFILSCNFSSKLIEPIKSRCAVFRFTALEENDVKEIVEHIAKNEKLKISDGTIKALFDISDGDCRKVENALQSCASISNKITPELIYDMVAAVNPIEIKNILEIAIKGDFVRARDLLFDVRLKRGLNGLDIIKQIQKEIWNLKLDDKKKIRLIDKCGEIEFRLVEGSDEHIQLETLLVNFIE